jgi:hypothetical protein
MNKKLLFWPIVFIILISLTYASELSIKNLKIYVNNEDQGNLKNNSLYSELIEPGDDIEFEIELENTFRDNTDINNIVITGTIYNITENNNLVENVTEFDLADDTTKIKKLRFEIPIGSDQLQKKLEIDIRGIDDNDKTQSLKWNIFLNIQDEDHDIQIYRAKLNQTSIRCNESSVDLFIWLKNNGKLDEDNVVLRISNYNLGVDKSYSGINIDQEVTYTKSLTLSDLNITRIGMFPIEIKAYYKGSILDDISSINLEVKRCIPSSVQSNNLSSENNNASEDVVVKEENQQISEPETNTGSNKKDVNTGLMFLVSIIILITLIVIIILVIRLIKRDEFF